MKIQNILTMLQMTVTTHAEMAQTQERSNLKKLEAAIGNHKARRGD
jgi:hypothetical protein